jgi:hypothetical protein
LQWTIEEILIFSNSSHLEWRAGLSDTLLKGAHPGTIPARFGLIWFVGFRGEDLNVKVYKLNDHHKKSLLFYFEKESKILKLRFPAFYYIQRIIMSCKLLYEEK